MLRPALTTHKPNRSVEEVRMRVASALGQLGITVAVCLGTNQAGRAQDQPRTRDVITREEIEATHVEDAYQLVVRLRPEFLQRGQREKGTAGVAGSDLDTDPETENEHFKDGRARGSAVVPATRRATTAVAPYSPEFDRGGNGAGSSTTRAAAPAAADPALTGVNRRRTLRGPRTAVIVYVGNVPLGGVEELATLPASGVKEIRYLSPSDAQLKFGPRHGAAVILVTLLE
jgi:hypothetical protein